MLENQAEFIVEPNQDFEKNFDEHIFFFKYEGIIRKIILDYKFHDKSYLYKTLVNFLVKNKKFFKILKSYDTIVPVPISTKRKKVRGYNQSDLLAKELVKHTNNLKLENKCLYKTKNIIEQSKLNKESRKINIQGVYELKNMQKLAGKKILLLDDIYTTGSTANECCKVIKQANPKKIGILTIAKD
jgi:ComF family protein